MIRCVSPADADSLAAIEAVCFTDDPWTAQDFLEFLGKKRVNGLVYLHDGRIVGYFIYYLVGKTLIPNNLTVTPARRRLGIGSTMLNEALAALHCRRSSVVLRESDLVGQLFLKKAGFRCVAVWRRHWKDTGETGYAFSWRFPGREPIPQNRIAKHFKKRR